MFSFVSCELTIKVEEVIVLVDMWSSICWRPCWAHVVLQPPAALLLVPRLASVPADIQHFTTGRARRVLFQPRTQAGAVHGHTQRM